ncbi:MAG TPA: hypothetical protein VFD57_08040 [Clostridia bacterium]|nr:hypothetical protein [Clostridia bacterium]
MLKGRKVRYSGIKHLARVDDDTDKKYPWKCEDKIAIELETSSNQGEELIARANKTGRYSNNGGN